MVSPPRRLSLLVAAVLLLTGGVLAAVQFEALGDYESTTGTVETVDIDTVANGTVEPDLANLTRAGEQLYEPDVTYTYTVEGATYTGANVAYGTKMLMGDRGKLSAALAGVQPGATTVYYDPENPADAHLLQRLDFFPAGVLLLCGLLAVADALTPRPRVLQALTALFPIATLGQVPGVEQRPVPGDAEDPTEILTAKRTWAGTDPAPFSGDAGAAIWLLCYLCIVDLVIAYFLLSSPPYDLWVVAAGFVVVAGLARLGFRRVLE